MARALQLLLVLGIVSLFGCDGSEPADQKLKIPRLIEYVRVKGSCLEDHVRDSWKASFEGHLKHVFDVRKNAHRRYGNVQRTDYKRDYMRKILDQGSGQYHSPAEVFFDKVQANIFALNVMTLKGWAQRGYATTCELTVVERRDRLPSQDEQAPRKHEGK